MIGIDEVPLKSKRDGDCLAICGQALLIIGGLNLVEIDNLCKRNKRDQKCLDELDFILLMSIAGINLSINTIQSIDSTYPLTFPVSPFIALVWTGSYVGHAILILEINTKLNCVKFFNPEDGLIYFMGLGNLHRVIYGFYERT